ncbi:MAG TPA: GAF domain-containing protein [Thermoleophilaceae bacterium]
MAASPDGAFFPHERDLLDVYARYAAAVLDTATALDEARRRHEEAQALLGLAQSVATANTSQDVAERLAGAVPAVVDCDRVFVFLWDEVEQALVHHASGGDPGPSGDIARQLRITPDDTPRLRELRASPMPEPIFFDAHPDDPFLEATMRATGALALVVVPIVANERFYGTMNVSVTERPERLAPSPALLDTLAGAVAQAATALDNARLIESMAHQARQPTRPPCLPRGDRRRTL